MKKYTVRNPIKKLLFTGERFLPGVRGQIEFEHYHRYLFALQFCRDKKVLDIACGEGYGSALIAQVAESVVGIDVSDESIVAAKINYEGPRLSFQRGDCSTALQQFTSFDVIVSFETIEHLEDQHTFLAASRDLLGDNGVFISSTPDKRIYSPNGPHNAFHLKELDDAEYRKLVYTYFSEARFASQKSTSGSIILPDDSPADNAGVFYRADETTFSAKTQLTGAPFRICVASNSALPSLGWSILDDDQFAHHVQISLEEASAIKRKVGELEEQITLLTARQPKAAEIDIKEPPSC